MKTHIVLCIVQLISLIFMFAKSVEFPEKRFEYDYQTSNTESKIVVVNLKSKQDTLNM